MARRRIQPVKARAVDARAYERVIRQHVVDPVFKSMWSGLSRAANATAAYRLLMAGAQSEAAMEAAEHGMIVGMNALDLFHRQRMIQTFRSALAIDIRPFLQRPPVDRYMDGVIRRNVSLIRSIGPDAHAGLHKRLHGFLKDNPFDRNAVYSLVRKEYGVTHARAKLIARDQTSKTIGKLTEYRQTQCGIKSYKWRTKNDERVRPTHYANNNHDFLWTEPPHTGHPKQDIQCRCEAIPIVPELLASGATVEGGEEV